MTTKKQLIAMLDSYEDDDVVAMSVEHSVNIRSKSKPVNGTDGVEQTVADELED